MIGVIIQARMGSTRLPGKVLNVIEENTLLYYSVYRSRLAYYVDDVIVATTTHCDDDVIEVWCENNNVNYFRGSEQDVLDRYYGAAKQYNMDIIIRITSDCPFIDPTIIDMLASTLINFECDYISNRWKTRTWPHGLDVEVFTFASLEKAWREAKLDKEREHVTPYILENPDKFNIIEIPLDKDLSHIRLTVDYEEDMKFVEGVMPVLIRKYGIEFNWKNLMKILNKNKEYLAINQNRCDIKLY